MTSLLDGLLRFLALAVGLVAGGVDSVSLPILLGAAGLAGLTVVVSVVTIVSAIRALAARGGDSDPAARRPGCDDAELPVLVVQSDPDADGHVRSRAPGREGPFPALAAALA